MGMSTNLVRGNVGESEVDSIKMLGWDLGRRHFSTVLPRRLPTLVVADDVLPDIATFALGPIWRTAVGLAFVVAIAGLCTAIPKLGAAHVQWACLAGLLGVLATLGVSITVRLAALAAVGWPITTPVVFAATRAVGAFPVLGTSKIWSTFLDGVIVAWFTLVDGAVARRGLIVGTPRHVCPRPRKLLLERNDKLANGFIPRNSRSTGLQ